MSTSQEKLEQRARIFIGELLASRSLSTGAIAAAFARGELQKAAEIADDYQRSVGTGKPRNIGAEIRKLME